MCLGSRVMVGVACEVWGGVVVACEVCVGGGGVG